MKTITINLDQITRFELIDDTGRVWVGGPPYDPSPTEVDAYVQDNGRTLKIIVKRNKD
jgi:hypothetical protein